MCVEARAGCLRNCSLGVCVCVCVQYITQICVHVFNKYLYCMSESEINMVLGRKIALESHEVSLK